MMVAQFIFQRKGAGAGNTSYVGHRLEERDAPISDKLLNGTFALDECIIKPTYQDVYDALYGKHKVTEEVAVTRNRQPEKEPDVPESKGFDLDDIKAMSRKELISFIEVNSIKIDPDDYDEKSELASAVIALIGGGDGGDAKNEAPTCPHKGGEFGVKFDEYKECPNCTYMDECSDAYDKLKAAAPAIKLRNKK